MKYKSQGISSPGSYLSAVNIPAREQHLLKPLAEDGVCIPL